MKSIVFVVLVSVGLLGTAVNSQQPTTNFCDPSLCPSGETQTGCNNPGTLKSTCPADAAIIPLTADMKAAIVKRHNQHRQVLASGGMLPKFQPAIHMATMRWNNELATLALDNAVTCAFTHDKCRATTQFRWSGQNLAKNWWSAGYPTDLINSVFIPQIDAWWAENVNTTAADISSYPASPSHTIGHFTVMTSEKNTAIGCGAVQFHDPARSNWASITLMCNYARTNIIGVAMYRTGAKASLCVTGVNPNFPALCSLTEPYNVNEA